MSATPILDLEEPPPKAPSSWKPRIVGGVIGVAIASLPVLRDQNMLPDLNIPGFNALLMIPALYLCIALHELGHLVAGKMADFPPGGISIGPLSFLKSGDKWIFHFNRRVLFGGFFKPMVSNPDGPIGPFAVMVAGGPLVSAAQAAISLAIWMAYGDGLWSATATMFWVSLVIVGLTAIPFSVGSNRTDAGLLWRFWREPRNTQAWLALAAVVSQEAEGVLPRDWNETWFTRVMYLTPDAPEYTYVQLLAMYRSMNRDEEVEAASHMENALRTSAKSGPLRHILFLEAAWISASVRQNSEQARTWLTRAIEIRKPESRDSIDGAIALCEKRYEEAIVHYQAAEARMALRKLDSGLVRYARENWAKQKDFCRAALTQAVSKTTVA